MDDIYILSDSVILTKISNHLKTVRLKQNITQQSLADSAGVSVSSIKKIESGEIRSFDSFIRVLRTLGLLNTLQTLTDDVPLSPNEYYELTHSAEKKNGRKRASGQVLKKDKEVSEW